MRNGYCWHGSLTEHKALGAPTELPTQAKTGLEWATRRRHRRMQETSLADLVVSGFLEGIHCGFEGFALDQDIVGVEGGDGDDGDFVFGQRHEERRQDASQR